MDDSKNPEPVSQQKETTPDDTWERLKKVIAAMVAKDLQDLAGTLGIEFMIDDAKSDRN